MLFVNSFVCQGVRHVVFVSEFRNDMPLVNESVILTMDLSALSKPVSETKVSDKIVGTLIVFLSRPTVFTRV